jgi:hypothetical protein
MRTALDRLCTRCRPGHGDSSRLVRSISPSTGADGHAALGRYNLKSIPDRRSRGSRRYQSKKRRLVLIIPAHRLPRVAPLPIEEKALVPIIPAHRLPTQPTPPMRRPIKGWGKSRPPARRTGRQRQCGPLPLGNGQASQRGVGNGTTPPATAPRRGSTNRIYPKKGLSGGSIEGDSKSDS